MIAGLQSGIPLQSTVVECAIDEAAPSTQTRSLLTRSRLDESPRETPRLHQFRCQPALATALLTGACSSADGKTNERAAPPAVAVSVAAGRRHRAADRPVHPRHRQPDGRGPGRRRRRNGRPRRGDADRARDRGPQGTELIRLSATETDAQVKEAEANAAQIEARLGLTAGAGSRRQRGARSAERQSASYELAQSEFTGSSRCSISASSRSRSSTSAARRWKRPASSSRRAKNGAAQQYQALQAARARVALAHKALADTVVRAPFNGLVAERLVSVGDYVTKGMKVAVVVRVNPLARAADGARAVRVGDLVGRSRSRSRSTPIRAAQFAGKVRYRLADARSRSARADGRSDRPQRRQRAEAGPVRDGPHRAAEADAGAWSCRRPRCAPPAARAGCSSSTATRSEERIVTVGQTVERWSRSPTASRPANGSRPTNVAQLADGSEGVR